MKRSFYICVILTIYTIFSTSYKIPFREKYKTTLQYGAATLLKSEYAALRLKPLFSSLNGDFVKSNKEYAENEFQWKKQWYPLAVEECLNEDAPNLVHLLGKRYVLWKENSGKWVLMDESCPHRLASLALGKIDREKGMILLTCRLVIFSIKYYCIISRINNMPLSWMAI